MLQPGIVINETYRVERLLGSGGMADVYLVTHTRMPRQFALKVMRIEGSLREKFLERFNREVQILATLRNAHIVDVIDTNQLADGSPYLVMELLEGEDLAAYILRTAPLAAPVALKICSQVGEALMAAHNVGVVHRDLKPSNIFLSNRGPFPNFVKVLDFGIAKLTQATGKLATQAGLIGTPAYMSPEQARGLHEQIDGRSDQFALAAVLYEMIAGRGAFYRPEDTVYGILDRVINQEPDPLPQPQLWKAVKRALSKNPEQRFPSLKVFLGAVGATSQTIYQPGLVAPAPDNSTLGNKNGEVTIAYNPPTPQQRRRRRIIIAGVGLLSVASLFAGWRYWQAPPWNKQLAASSDSSSSQESPNPAFDLSESPAQALRSPSDPADGPAPNAEPDVVALLPNTATAPSGGSLANPVAGALTAASSVASARAPTVSSEQDGQKLPPGNKDNASSATPAPRQLNTDTKPAPSTSKPSGSAGKATSPRSGPLLFIIKGIGVAAQDDALRGCLNKHLAKIASLEGSTIKLERSGSLQVVDAPPVVLQTNFDACLEQAFAGFYHSQIPKVVFIRAVR